MKKHKTTTIHSKVFLGMSVTAVLFLILLLAATSTVFSRHFLNMETSAALKHLDYISNQFEYYLTSTRNYSQTILIDPTVQEEMSKQKNNRETFNAMDVLSIKNQINRIIQSTPFIHSVTLYSSQGEPVATTEHHPMGLTLPHLNYSDKGNWSSSIKKDVQNKNLQIQAVSFIRPLYNYSTAQPLGYLEIALPEEVFSHVYEDNTSPTNHIFVVNARGIVQNSDGSHSYGELVNFFDRISKSLKGDYSFEAGSILLSRYFPTLDWYIINEIDLLDFVSPILMVLLVAVCMALVMIAACIYVSKRIARTITSPIDHLITHTRTIREGNWIPIEEPCQDTDIDQLFHAFNSMIKAQEQLKNNLLESEKTKAKISLDLLQQQVNPHFLYNTLDNICALAELDEKKALIDIVMSLSSFYRESLSSGKFYVTIQTELDMTSAYLHIMQIRYYNKFDYSITCSRELVNAPCLKLLLQPIVENCIYHGIKELEYKGKLEITVSEKPSCIQIVVQDNGVGITQEAYQQIWHREGDHFGIKNIHQRIQLYYGKEFGLTIGNRKEGGCITTLRVGKTLPTALNSSAVAAYSSSSLKSISPVPTL